MDDGRWTIDVQHKRHSFPIFSFEENRMQQVEGGEGEDEVRGGEVRCGRDHWLG